MPDPVVTRAIECQPLPVEMVVRGYLTGVTKTSIWRNYEAGERSFGGHHAARRHEEERAAAASALTPTTKAEKGGHDENVTRDELAERGLVDAATFDQLAKMCLQLFAFGQKRAAERGLILVDTKYELGRTPDGQDRLHRRDPHARFVALLVRRRLRSSACRAAKSRARSTRSTCAAGTSTRATTATGTPPEIPDERARRGGAALHRRLRAGDRASSSCPTPTSRNARIRKNLGIK